MSISLTHFAARTGDRNDRAMTGSRLVASALADRFGLEPVVIGTPAPPLGGGWSEELEAARGDLLRLQARYDEILGADGMPMTALGRCAAALATLPAVARHRPDAVVTWFDAHADINTPSSSPTGYLGGLAFAGPLGLWDSGLGSGVASRNATLVGTRDVDAPEQELIDAGAVRIVPPGPDFPCRLREAIAGRPVYLHLDCDVLEPDIMPTEYRVPHGLSLDDLHAAASVIAESELVGLEIAELEADAGHAPHLVLPLLDALEPVLAQ